MAADRLDFLGDGESAAPDGALERHVLEEMRDPVDVSLLMPSAYIHPNPERDRVDGVDAVGSDPQSVRQSGQVRCHSISDQEFPARRARARIKRVTAPRSLGNTASLSRLSRISLRAAGNIGRTPVARSTTSGNFAGWAQARAIIGALASPAPISVCAAATAIAVWGSISKPDWA